MIKWRFQIYYKAGAILKHASLKVGEVHWEKYLLLDIRIRVISKGIPISIEGDKTHNIYRGICIIKIV